MRPLGDRVLVEPDPEVKETSSGVKIPPTERKTPHYGTVVAIGSTVTEVVKGDRVHFSKYAGVEFSHEGKGYVYIRQSDVFSVIQ